MNSAEPVFPDSRAEEGARGVWRWRVPARRHQLMRPGDVITCHPRMRGEKGVADPRAEPGKVRSGTSSHLPRRIVRHVVDVLLRPAQSEMRLWWEEDSNCCSSLISYVDAWMKYPEWTKFMSDTVPAVHRTVGGGRAHRVQQAGRTVVELPGEARGPRAAIRCGSPPTHRR